MERYEFVFRVKHRIYRVRFGSIAWWFILIGRGALGALSAYVLYIILWAIGGGTK